MTQCRYTRQEPSCSLLHPAVDRHQFLRRRGDQAVRQQGAPVLERSLRPVEHDYHLWRLRKVGLEEVSKGGEARVLERDPERRLQRQVAARHVPYGLACHALQVLQVLVVVRPLVPARRSYLQLRLCI